MKLFVKCLSNYAVQKYTSINDQIRLERGDSGFDLYAVEDIEIHPRKTAKIPLGIACKPKESHGYYLYPRSSISKTPFRLANSVGIIDSGYRGEICAMVDNTSDEVQYIKQGDKLFQLCSPDLRPIEIEFVEELDETLRGSGGFGSTG